VYRAHDAIIQSQTDESAALYARNRSALVSGQMDLLADEPAQALKDLLSTSHGCMALYQKFERFGQTLRSQRCWRTGQCGEACRMTGVVPTLESLRQDETAYLLMYCNLRCQPDGGGAELEALSRPENRPEGVSDATLEELASPDAAHAWLLGLVEQWLTELEMLATTLRPKDLAERAQVVSPNLMASDDGEARRFLKYEATTTGTFLRAQKRLEDTLKSDAESGRVDVLEQSATASEGGKAVFANEPNATVMPAVRPEQPSRPAPAAASAARPAAAAPIFVSRHRDSIPEQRFQRPNEAYRTDAGGTRPENGPPPGG
jgi:hypothetical protein